MFNKLQKTLLGTILAFSFQFPVFAQIPVNWYSSLLTVEQDYNLINPVFAVSPEFYLVGTEDYIFAGKKWKIMLIFSKDDVTLQKIYLSRILDPKLSIEQQLDFFISALKKQFGDTIFMNNNPDYREIFWINTSDSVMVSYKSETRKLNIFIIKE